MPPRNRPQTKALVTRASLVILALVHTQAHAAVRQCAPAVTSVATDRTDEQNARRNAITAWANEARKLGVQYTSWRLAIDRSVICSKVEDVGFRCKVTAAPCTIQQNPSLAPPVRKPEAGPKPAGPKPANGISL
ncbi:MAG: hypothetical protein HOO99_00025 [Hyphomicrobiaceae bacterium]|nr:hypothetical protein [Hyphomicrobiaceae bacterium]